MASLLSPESKYSLLARRMIDALMMISTNILKFLEAHVSQIVKLRLYVLHHLSLQSGLPRGTILFTVALFSGLPLGVLFRMIQGGDRKGSWFQRKALLSLVSGTMISLMTFGKTTVHAFYLSLPSLCLLKLTSSTKAGDSKTKSERQKRIGVGFVTFLWSFGYLVYIHYSADSGGEWKRGNIDITGLLLSLIHISEPTRPY